MFILKKLVTPFLLPPGIFIAILLVMGGWSVSRKNRWAAGISFGVGIALWLAALSPSADILMRSLEADYPIPQLPRADVIIMLGGGTYNKAPDFSGIGAPGPSTMERLVTAARLQRRLGIPIIVSGGKVMPTNTPIAILAERVLIDLGIAKQNLILEHQSRDTYENALYSKKICDQYGFQKPIVVTSGFHLKRAVFSFRKVGLTVIPYPCAITTWKNKEYHWRHMLPDSGSLSATAAALHEWLGLFYYRLVY